MIIAATSTPQSPTATGQSATPSPSGITSDFETFLRMLTAQARNQDPLEPLDSSEYAAQLAQFSMVEQQVQTNNLLSSLAMAMGSGNLGQLSSWIGMDVSFKGDFHFSNTPVAMSATADPSADKAVIIVRNAEDVIVDRQNVPVDGGHFHWAGVDENGNPLPEGMYSASLASYQGNDLLSEHPITISGRVIEAQLGDGIVTLTLDSGEVVSTSQVTQIRTSA